MYTYSSGLDGFDDLGCLNITIQTPSLPRFTATKQRLLIEKGA